MPALAPPRRGVPVDGSLSRFSPLTAPERQVVDAFCADTRPWALRQAKRSYRHLPSHVREQAVDRAMQELRTSAPPSVDRRRLMTDFAELLTESLRHLHVGWCLNESTARLRREGLDERQGFGVAQDGLAEFVEQGLGGLERAVLQLEIGAGRDSRTTRAALRLGPREYSRHREEGLSKLRDAISARVHGRVCEQHLSSVVLAATGDRHAASMLQAGSGRCRACAREAHGLRAVLNERLAVAPWPLVIKPAGVLAAKVGAVTAIFGGKSAGGAGAVAIGSSSGAGAAATVIAAAALATGATALVEDGNAVRHATPQAASAQHVSKRAAGRQVRSQHAAAAPSRSHRPAAHHAVTAKPATAKLHAKVTATKPRTVRPPVRSTTTTASAPTTAGTQSAAAPSAPTAPTLTNTVDSTVTKVREGVKNVTDKVLPKTLADPVDTTLQGVQDTVKGVTGTVDQLLKPKP